MHLLKAVHLTDANWEIYKIIYFIFILLDAITVLFCYVSVSWWRQFCTWQSLPIAYFCSVNNMRIFDQSIMRDKSEGCPGDGYVYCMLNC